ncbi:MAG TPA: hypothetical protein VJO54_09200 [Burkholderiales bacterium]|jgi:hypothetical protein|nr:hypothetical protein [Burkholderiales bacterium]
MFRLRSLLLLAVPLCATAFATGARAAPSGAIFTTVADGTEVNANIYADKGDVYLDGGPGPGAPQAAAGLDDGTYVFQVTEPSGKTLLSQDPAKCRQIVVSGGIITSLVITGCQHVAGLDVDHNALTVQLMPYADTPNPGGEYKAWVVQVADFLQGCAALGVPNGLDVVDCGKGNGNFHGFIPRNTKTDNYKVGRTNNLEIDTRFMDDATGQLLDGLRLTWTDTLGSTNTKYSYSSAQINHFAHIEAVEAGVHGVTIADQPGCKVVKAYCYDTGHWCSPDLNGGGTINVTIRQNDPVWTKYLYVYCNTAP